MSQKDYNLKIIENLLIKQNHIRGLAKDLHTNQTTIARKIQELYDENVVDFVIEGKNKKYHLKKTLEAKQHACILEQHKLIDLLNKYPFLRMIVEEIKKNNKIHLALLFGSYAKGLAKNDSDIDVYIETTDLKLKHEIEKIHTKLSVKIGVYDPNNLLIKEIGKNHIILKGTEDYYEKNQFFT
jgi:predicted nucleotidyltransferase